jgi:serine/threonine protein kinase
MERGIRNSIKEGSVLVNPATGAAYEVISERALGEGAFGCVYQARRRPMGGLVSLVKRLLGMEPETCALKLLKGPISAKDESGWRREVELLGTFRGCPYTVRLLDAFRDEATGLLTMAMEPVCWGSLEKRVMDTSLPAYGPAKALEWATEVGMGLLWLEEKGVYHGDLALRNILLTAPDGRALLTVRSKNLQVSCLITADRPDIVLCSGSAGGTGLWSLPEARSLRYGGL